MALIIALAVGLVLTPLSIRFAHRTGALDHPGDLKVHDEAVPHLGGVAVFVAMSVPLITMRPLLVVLVGCALILGATDDVGDLPIHVRIIIEAVIGIAIATVEPGHGILSFAFSVLITVALINAVNLLDGLDAVASGVAVAASLGFAIVLSGDYRTLALSLAGALLALLVWNRPPAKVYLGDGGSYVIGATLAILLAEAFRAPHSGAMRAGALLLVAVPVADTTVAIVRRHRAGRPLLRGDRGHLYDQLVDRGASTVRAAMVCIAAQVALAAVGVGIAGLPIWLAVAASFTVIVGLGGLLLATFTKPPPPAAEP